MPDTPLLIPFGTKYRGQPIEAVAADVPYATWLLAQPWLITKYPMIAAQLQTALSSTPEQRAYRATRAWLAASAYGPYLSAATEESRP